MTSSSTRPVPTSNGYVAPETPQSRVLAEMQRGLPRVDGNGFPIPDAVDPTVAAVVTGPNGETPTMAAALTAAAAAAGADVGALVDSQSFCRTVLPISPSDTAGLVSAIQNAVAQNPALALQPAAPGMRPNPAQGGSASGGAVPPRPKTVAEMIRAEAGKAAGQPVPPGSVV